MTIQQTQRRRQAVETIHDIVSALRAIAAGRIQSAQRALASARRYNEVVLRAIASMLGEPGALAALPAGGRPSLLLVMTSEQPLCGTFNQNVLALAERRWHELRQEGTVHLVVVGQRGTRQLTGRGLKPEASEPSATSVHGLRDLVKRLAALLGLRLATGEFGSLRVIYSRYQSISEQVPTEERILPPDWTRITQAAPPLPRTCYRYLSPPALLAGLVREYAFITLYAIAAESFASEQASRLIAMDGATRNTERLLKGLKDLERRERQGEITRQVLELIGARFAIE